MQRGKTSANKHSPVLLIISAGTILAGCGAVLETSQPLGEFLAGYGVLAMVCGIFCVLRRRKHAQGKKA